MDQRLLSIFLLVLFSGFFSHADGEKEKVDPQTFLMPKDIYFQPGGGLRVRYENLRNATGGGFPENEDESQASHRAQFDIRLHKGEYIETFFRFLNFSNWGDSAGDTSGGQKDSLTRTNGLLVNQAWGLWKVDESFGFKFGRAPLHLGLGYTYGMNDWFNVPYSFDMVEASGDWESIKLQFIAAKVNELTQVSGQTLSSDPEENHYILNLDVKNLIDAIDTMTFYVVQANRDLGSQDGGVTVLNGLNMQRLGLEAEIVGKNLFGSLFFTYVTGEEKVAPINQQNGVEKVDLKQTAFDFRMGYRFPEYNNFRFWGGYHFDSGDKDESPNENKSYSNFYYEAYGQSGVMDLIRWGNLSLLRMGAELELVSNVNLGSEVLMMERTEASDTIQFGDAGRFYSDLMASGDLTLGDDKKIGNEWDLWLDFHYPSGVNVRVTYAHFFPGGVFEGATTSSGRAPDSSFFQFLTQVGYSF